LFLSTLLGRVLLGCLFRYVVHFPPPQPLRSRPLAIPPGVLFFHLTPNLLFVEPSFSTNIASRGAGAPWPIGLLSLSCPTYRDTHGAELSVYIHLPLTRDIGSVFCPGFSRRPRPHDPHQFRTTPPPQNPFFSPACAVVH